VLQHSKGFHDCIVVIEKVQFTAITFYFVTPLCWAAP